MNRQTRAAGGPLRKTVAGTAGIILLLAGCSGLEQQAAAPAASSAGETRARVTTNSVVTGVTVPLQAGWNSVGLQSQRVTALSSNPAIPGFAFYANGAYETRSLTAAELNVGPGGRRGLFVRADSPTSFTYSGEDDGQGNFVDVVSGWNLVSFTTSTDLPASSLSGLGSVVLPTFQQINADNTFTQVDVQAGGVLRAGRAYWVFASGAARLTLPATPSPASPAASPSPASVSGPTLTGLSPTGGWIGGTSGVVLTGSGFRGATEVRFGNVPVHFTVVSDTQILADAPPQSLFTPPASVVSVQVVTPGGASPVGPTYTYTTSVPPTTNPPGGGGAAPPSIAFVRELGTSSATLAVGTTTTVITTTAASTVGDSILVWFAGGGNAASGLGVGVLPTVADSAGNTYTLVNGAGVSGAHALWLYRSLNTTASLPLGGTITITHATSTADDVVTATAVEFSGLTAVDVNSAFGSEGTTATPSMLGGTTTTANELVVAVFSPYNTVPTAAPTFTADSATPSTPPFTALAGTTALSAARSVGLYPQFRIVSTTGAQTAPARFGSTSEFDGLVTTFR